MTALAVLNFVFSGLAVIGILGLVVVVTMAGSLKEAAQTADERATFEALENMNMGLWALILASNVVAFATLLIAGIGYLKMRRWGRLFGNVYAVTAIVTALMGVFMSPAELGAFSDLFGPDVKSWLTPQSAVRRRRAAGGTSPSNVQRQLRKHRR